LFAPAAPAIPSTVAARWCDAKQLRWLSWRWRAAESSRASLSCGRGWGRRGRWRGRQRRLEPLTAVSGRRVLEAMKGMSVAPVSRAL